MSEQDDWRNRPPEQGAWPTQGQPYPGPPQPGPPQYGPPQYGQPHPGAPQYGQPQYGQPQYGQPQYGQPQYGQPQYGPPQYGPPPGYPPAPGYAGRPGGPLPTPPRSVDIAAGGMLLRVLVSLVSIVVTVASKDSIRDRILRDHHDYDPQKVSDVLNSIVAINLVVGIVFAVFYLVLAWQIRRGRQWARVVTWVLGGLALLSTFGLAGGDNPSFLRALGVLEAVVTVVVVVALAVPASNTYFQQVRAARRGY